MTDSEMLDWLEAEMKRDPLVLHNLENPGNVLCGLRGLGLIGGQRTLREAIKGAAGYPK